MTFEEFLIKKKIDAVQLKTAEPALFSEFNNHYDQMGEKSFDHSKKFWFNKLRRFYHLKEEPKPAKEIVEINQLASQAEPLISPTLQATGYRPRFKSGVSDPAVNTQPAENTEASPVKPAYKPRFKAQAPPQEKSLAEEIENDIKSDEQPKPAYKPRFRAQIIKDTEEGTSEEIHEDIIPKEIPKPAYKPRFKPSMVKPPEKEE